MFKLSWAPKLLVPVSLFYSDSRALYSEVKSGKSSAGKDSVKGTASVTKDSVSVTDNSGAQPGVAVPKDSVSVIDNNGAQPVPSSVNSPSPDSHPGPSGPSVSSLSSPFDLVPHSALNDAGFRPVSGFLIKTYLLHKKSDFVFIPRVGFALFVCALVLTDLRDVLFIIIKAYLQKTLFS
jgi:hypothetical protein